MALAWQKLRYGTLVLTGVAVTGTTIYVTTRNQMKPVDLITLMEGVEERQRAVNWNVAPSPVISTQQIHAWTSNTNGWTYPVPDGTNTPGASNYLVYAGPVDLVTTSDVTGLSYSSTYRKDIGRYVWAGWSNLTVSAFPTGAVPINGTYTLQGS